MVPAAHATVTNLVLANLAGHRATNTLAVPAGQVAKLITISTQAESGWFTLSQYANGVRVLRAIQLNAQFHGPCLVEFSADAGGGEDGQVTGLLAFDLAPVANAQAAPLIPSTAVVIPADASGPVTIILESSMDLITWNAALPGQYGASTTNRFFRVRAVR